MRVPRRQTRRPFVQPWRGGRPSVALVLAAVNIACYLAQTAVEIYYPGLIEEWLALSNSGLRALHAWQLLSYMFLHVNALHLLVNMTMLYFAGREVESIAGPKHLLGIYFLGGLIGGIAQIALAPSMIPLVGASAGVCAVSIAFTTILPELRLTALLFFVLPIRLRAKYLAAGIIGSSILFLATGFMPEVGHLAHLGGCLVGWLYVHQLGYGNPWRIQRYVFEKRQRAYRFERMSSEQFMAEEIDPILDKIAREGLHSLTRTERRILEKGREKLKR